MSTEQGIRLVETMEARKVEWYEGRGSDGRLQRFAVVYGPEVPLRPVTFWSGIKDWAARFVRRCIKESAAHDDAVGWPPRRESERTCWTCGHHDDHVGKCICGDAEIVPVPAAGEPPCPAWEPRKEGKA